MKCPLKYGLYDFEGGQGCIGIECGMHKLCGANDTLAAKNGVSEASVDANDANAMQDSREKLEEYIRWRFPVLEGLVIECIDRQAVITERECFERGVFDLGAHKRIIEQDRTIVEYADKNAELQAKVDGYVEALEKLGCSVLENGTVFWPSDCGASCSELQKQVDELTAELEAARNAHAQAEHEAVILREKLGRMLDNAHEITRIGGDC